MSRRSVSRKCGPAGEVGEPHTAAHLESNIIALIHLKRRQTNTTCPHRNQPAARRIKIKAPLCSSLQTGKQLTRKPSGESGVRVIPRWEFLRFLETFWRAISPGQSAQHTFISLEPTRVCVCFFQSLVHCTGSCFVFFTHLN